MRLKIYCAGCGDHVDARLTSGAECYPHRPDLVALPFWKCDGCGNWVGCHHKTSNRTRPLGCIPTREITAIRKQIHGIIDPLYKNGSLSRREVYRRIASELGIKSYHTGAIKSLDEANKVLVIAKKLELSVMATQSSPTAHP